MKKLVVYYSFEGNTRFISGEIAKESGADTLELKPKNEPRPRGFMKFIWGGKQVFFRVKPELVPFDKDPSAYDMIFLGTPVWAWRHAPAVESFFSQVRLTNKKIALFCCHGGGKGKALEKMKEKLPGNEIVGQMDFKEPLGTDKQASAAKARDWTRQLGNRGS